METKGFFNLKKCHICLSSDSFDVLCYGSTAIINSFTLTLTLDVRIWRLQMSDSRLQTSDSDI